MSISIRPRSTASGFTLLEVMVAVSIFAIISIVVYRGLSSVVQASSQLQQEQRALDQLLRALDRVERDLQQATIRSARNFADVKEPALVGDASGFAFSSLVVQSTESGVRFANVRVQHRFASNSWLRSERIVLDVAPNSAEQNRELLTEFSGLQIQYFDQNATPSATWPTAATSYDPNYNTDTLPKAIEIKLRKSPYGEIRKLIWIGVDEPGQERRDAPG